MKKGLLYYSVASLALLSSGLMTHTTIAADPVVTYSSHKDIDENDDPIKVASKGILFTAKDPGNKELPGAPVNMPFYQEADLMTKALSDSKAEVKASASMASLNTEVQFEQQYQQKFKSSLQRKPLTLTGDGGEALSIALSPKMVKALKTYIRNTAQRGEWEKDTETGSLFSFLPNKLGDISVITEDIGICTPFFTNAKGGLGTNYLTPYGKDLTKQQKQYALFLHNVMGHFPTYPLKTALRLAKEHKNENSEGLWNLLTGKNVKQLPSTINYDEAYGKLKRVYDFHRVGGVRQLQEGNETQILQRALTRIKWQWDRSPNTNPVGHAWEEVVGKPWSFYTTSSQTLQDVNLTLTYTLQYHAGRRVPDYENLKDFEQKEVIRVARNLYLQGEKTRHKTKPDTSELNRAIAVFKTYPL